MSGIGSCLYSALVRMPVVGPALTWVNQAQKQELIEYIKKDKDNTTMPKAIDLIFDTLHYCYKTDPDVVITIIKVSQHHSGLDHNYVIENLPEELRTREFVVRILKEVIFERIHDKPKVAQEDFVMIDRSDGKLYSIQSQAQEALLRVARGKVEPLEHDVIRSMLLTARNVITTNRYYLRSFCITFW